MTAPLESPTVSFRPSLRDPLQVETASYVTPVAVPTRPNRPLPLFSFDAPDGDVKLLRTPLMLRVTEEDGEIFVENEALNIFGHGKTLHAAIQAFSRDLAYFWTYYRGLPDEDVARDGATLKGRYEDLVG